MHFSPLMHVIELKEENVPMVELLLDAGATVNQDPLVSMQLGYSKWRCDL